MWKNPYSKAAAALALPLIASIVWSQNSQSRMRITTLPDSVRSDMRRSLQEWRASKSYSEWNQGAHHPRNILEMIQSLEGPAKVDALEGLCQGLIEISRGSHPEDLELFSSALHAQEETTLPLTCPIDLSSSLANSASSFQRPIQTLRENRSRNLKPNQVLIAFQGQPNTVVTPKILEVLEKHQIHAHFFWKGAHLKSATSKDLVAQVSREGHLVATLGHSIDDFSQPQIVEASAVRDLVKGRNLLATLTQKPSRWMMFPQAIAHKHISLAPQKAGLHVLQPHLESQAWASKSREDGSRLAKEVFARQSQKLGSVVLFFDGLASTPDALEDFIKKLELRSDRVEVVRLTE